MIIAVSKKVKKEIESYYHVKSEKIVIIENGTRFSLTQEERSHRYNRNTLRTGIFISSNHQWKGISIVEELATLMKDYRFFICGWPYTSKQQNIEYRWNLSHEDLLNTMHSSDFLILPSQYEGQSLAVLEAMSLGLVIVGGKEIDPFIGDTNRMGIILANRKNVSEYRDRMRWLESNPETIHRIQEYNMRITWDYTWEKQGRRYSSEFVRVFPHLPWNT
jgi:glycosyltransferase involved in cell wall biosynthesis